MRDVLVLAAALLVTCAPHRDAPAPAAVPISPEPVAVATSPEPVAVATSAEPVAPATSPEPGVPPSASAPPPVAPASARPTATAVSTVVSQLLELHRFLERRGLTLGEVVTRVGPIKGKPAKGSCSDELEPRARWIRRARVACYPRDGASPAFPAGAIYLLELDLVSEARPTIRALRSVFGDDRRRPGRGLHGERGTIFYPPGQRPTKDNPWAVAVLASLLPCWDPHSDANPPPWPCTPLDDDSLVEKIAFRRDSP